MRQLRSHWDGFLNNNLAITMTSQSAPFSSVAQRYEISGFNLALHPFACGKQPEANLRALTVLFHVGENGLGEEVNGVTPEALLAICEDQILQGQNVADLTGEKLKALCNIAAALDVLHCRTRRLHAAQNEVVFDPSPV